MSQRQQLEQFLEEWEQNTPSPKRSAFVVDKRGYPLLLLAAWTDPLRAAGRVDLDVLAHLRTTWHSTHLMAELRDDRAEIVDIQGTQDIDRGIGTAVLQFAEGILAELGARQVRGMLSEIDIGHRDRQVRFYEKNGYTVTLTGSAGRVIKSLD